MSLHRQSQFQRAHRQETADSCRSPLSLSGDICPSMLATGWCVAFGAAPRPVNRPLGPSSIRVNNLFAILFQKLSGDPEKALTRRGNGDETADFKGTAAMPENAAAPTGWRRGAEIRRQAIVYHAIPAAIWSPSPVLEQLAALTGRRFSARPSPEADGFALPSPRFDPGNLFESHRPRLGATCAGAVSAIRKPYPFTGVCDSPRRRPPKRPSLTTRYSRASPRLRPRCGRSDI